MTINEIENIIANSNNECLLCVGSFAGDAANGDNRWFVEVDEDGAIHHIDEAMTIAEMKAFMAKNGVKAADNDFNYNHGLLDD